MTPHLPWSHRLSLGWGLHACATENAVAAWGARAVLLKVADEIEVCLLPDRQDSESVLGYTMKQKESFFEWINRVGLPWVRDQISTTDLAVTNETAELVEQPYRICASAQGSSSFLYLRAEELATFEE